MTSKRNRTKTKETGKADRTYAQALAEAANLRLLNLAVNTSVVHPPRPEILITPATQVKLATIRATMSSIGRTPGDVPVVKFDKAVNFRKLEPESLDWLERLGVPARRDFAPLAADYISLFGDPKRLPVEVKDRELFLSRFVHCLVVETQIILARQYFHGLNLYQPNPSPIKMMQAASPDEHIADYQLASLNTVDFTQLHGRIFLEYSAVMIRAQWDKLTRLACFAIGDKANWDSISDGIKSLEKEVLRLGGSTNAVYSHHLLKFTEIAKEQVGENGWLKKFRDPLLHEVGIHSEGVAPQSKSIDTTSEMWDKVCNEHDCLREAMIAAIIVFVTRKAS